MTSSPVLASPPRWTLDQLSLSAAVAIALFREERLAVSADIWPSHYLAACRKFEQLFETLGDLRLDATTDRALAEAFGQGLGEPLRYLAGPPISADDLRVLAAVRSLAPSVLAGDPAAARKVFDVIQRVIDRYRFPWVMEGTLPTAAQRAAALMASAVLLATQRTETMRRSEGKEQQEAMVKDYLRGLRFEEVAPTTIRTVVDGPAAGQFCGECMLGDRKADVVVRLHDTRVLAIECKVSNSATNSVKRLNNDAAAKAEHWTTEFGTKQVVAAAVLSGVFKVINLHQAQRLGLALFWAHDLAELGRFIASTENDRKPIDG